MDCSTFSFDLHVLGAPPALILSRDQTLIVCCEFAKSPRLTQSTDEFFFTASNQIVKDLRNRPGDPALASKEDQTGYPASKAVLAQAGLTFAVTPLEPEFLGT